MSARPHLDDFSEILTAPIPQKHPPIVSDDDIRTRLADGSNPPMPRNAASRLEAEMTTPMPRFRPPPGPPIEPTQVRLINPDNFRQTGPTSIHIKPEPEPPTEIRHFEAAEVDNSETELRPMTQPEGPYCPVGAPQLAAYQIVRKIAVGGMGIVYEAYHRASGQRVAVKYMRRVAADKPELVQRFLAEAVAASRIEHPGVAEVYDYGHDDEGVPYLVMEYLEGECLAERLSRGSLSPAEFMAISKQIAFILEEAHRSGIVHRDLKPDNIFLLDGEEPLRIKVLDFGVAKFQNNDLFLRTTKTGQMLGTPYYMSPEQCAGTGIDHRSDVYALGCVMYQMLTGRVPFAGNLIAVVTGHRRETPTPIAALNHTVPEALIHLIDHMMAKDIEQRPQSMAYVATALDMAAATPLPRSPTEVRSPSRSTPRMKLAETINSMGENHQRRAVRLGYPLALLLVTVAAVSVWLGFGL